jgi:hypothetical protein
VATPVRESSVEQTAGNSFTKPTGLADGNILEILYWEFHSGGTPPAAPSGFTETTGGGQVNLGANGFVEARRYRKVITNAAGEPASYSVTVGSGSVFANGGEIFRISGVNTSNPENATVTFGTAGSGTTATSGSLTTSVADCLLSAVIVTDGTAIGVPSGMSALFLHDGGDAEGYTENLSGTVSGVTRASTIGSAEWGFGLWAIEPAGGGGGGDTNGYLIGGDLFAGRRLVGGGLVQ